MKAFRKVLAFAAAAMLLLAAAGCSGSIDWNSVKNDDVVAKYGETELLKRQVAFKNAIDGAAYESASSMYSQLGLDANEMAVSMDDSLGAVVAYAVLAEYAAENGLTVSYEDAAATAYDEYILSAKKYDYLSSFSESIKTALYLSDDLLVERAAELYVLKDSAEAFIKTKFDESIDSYEDFDSLTAGVQQLIRELVADKTATVLYPKTHTLKCSDIDFDTIVKNASWAYSSVYTVDSTDTADDAEAEVPAEG